MILITYLYDLYVYVTGHIKNRAVLLLPGQY